MDKAVKEALKHRNVLGAGARKREHLNAEHTKQAVAEEWKLGRLHSGNGKIVPKNRSDIMKAIMMSEAKGKR